MEQKLDYIHNNHVKAGFVENSKIFYTVAQETTAE